MITKEPMFLVCDWQDHVNHYNLPDYYREELRVLCKSVGLELVFCENKEEWPDLNKIRVYVGNKPEAELLQSSTLEWIHFGSVGTDRINSRESKELGLTVTNARGVFDDAVGIHALSRIFNRLVPIESALNSKIFNRTNWEKITTKSNEAIFHILGHGSISQSLCSMLLNLGLNVRAYTRSPNNYDAVYDIVHLDYDNKRDAQYNNFVINLLPANKETTEYVNKAFFGKFTSIYYYLNIGRPQTESLSDIKDLMRTGFICNAGWDVIRDQRVFNNLKSEFGARVDCTPHIAAFTIDHWKKSFELLKRNLIFFKAKDFQSMENRVNV